METSEEHQKTIKENYLSSSFCLFIAQVFVIILVIAASIYNLSKQNGDTNLWTALLSSSIGYILPNPSIKATKKNEN